MSRILVVDDEPAIGWSLRERLGDEGHAVEVAASVEAAVDTCGRFTPDALLLDVRLPGRDGLSALPDLQALAPAARIVVMTAFGDLDTAVRAMNAGAFDYLVKPFDLESVSRVITRALADRPDASTPVSPAEPARDVHLVGTSPPMQAVFKQIALVAPTELPVLVTGATGTGKELAARAIHAHGPRRDRPVVATSLAALAPSVIESELFGHVRGAFTGAAADRTGLFDLAAGGTVFLDEIGEAPLDVQVKLLRVLDAREITPVGSATARPVDVRVIAATNPCSGDRGRHVSRRPVPSPQRVSDRDATTRGAARRRAGARRLVRGPHGASRPAARRDGSLHRGHPRPSLARQRPRAQTRNRLCLRGRAGSGAPAGASAAGRG
jgi:two-component system nitrogen regulation response regulator GlnG